MNEISLSEISFKDKKSDWIEISVNSEISHTYFVKDDSILAKIDPIQDIKYIIIHFKSEEEELILENNILHIYINKSGLTGTTEQITLESDSEIIEAVCWKNSSPTKSELEDIKKLNLAKKCINSEDITANQSIVKTSSGWEIFSHPTPGKENIYSNSKPSAVITIQKGTTEAEIPFSINLDGSSSNDKDQDKLKFLWKFPNLIIEKENPPSYKFETSGNYEISLTVTDQEGLSSTETIQIFALNKKEDLQSKYLLEQILQDQKTIPYTKEALPNWLVPMLAFSIILFFLKKALFYH